MNKYIRVQLALFGCFLLAACASPPSPPSLKDHNKAQIEEGTQRVEIFYSPEEHGVVHMFGESGASSMVNAGALFGAGGALFGAVLALAAERQSAEDSAERSREFGRLASEAAASAGQDMNREFAEQLASHVRASGREVRLTQVKRLPGHLPGSGADAARAKPAADACAGAQCPTPPAAAQQPPAPATTEPPAVAAAQAGVGYSPTPGYTPLLVRITTGYGAASVMNSYRPLVVVESALVGAERGEYLAHSRISQSPEGDDARQYLRWTELKEDVPAARQQLATRLFGLSAGVKAALFDFSAAP
ncbi:hypothetical protein WG922_06160 [Ramlibacter sp. AN1015]|uniref:hypothetical protein n=1 Tax=Ramlibacter sp. AN1015 TaxID=3133428 RepID=UPI0030C56429